MTFNHICFTFFIPWRFWKREVTLWLSQSLIFPLNFMLCCESSYCCQPFIAYIYIFVFRKLFLIGFLPCSSLCITTFPISCFCIDLCSRFFFLLFSEQEARAVRVNDVHTLVHRLPQQNREMLEIIMKHLQKWVMCKMCGPYSTDVKDSDHLGYYAE